MLWVLLVDELIGNLDFVIFDMVFEVFMMLVCGFGMVVLIVIYNLEFVVCMDCVVCLEDGKLV